MTERLLVMVYLPLASRELRDETLAKLKEIAQIALETEPGTLKYCICIPREDDGKSIYIIEEYTDKAAYDLHSNTERIKSIKEYIAEKKMPEDSMWQTTHEYLPGGFRFDRREVLQHPDPHLLFAELDYIPGGVETATPYWKAVVDTGRDHEEGTLVYGVAKDTTRENRLNTIEAYESPAYLKDVHVPSNAIQESIKNTKHLRTGLKHHALKRVSGYLYKEI